MEFQMGVRLVRTWRSDEGTKNQHLGKEGSEDQ
jgi:hypothetical protein